MSKLLNKVFGKETSIAEPCMATPTEGIPKKHPKKAPNRSRPNPLMLRYSAEEMEEINAKVAASGLKKNEFVLRCIRGQKVIVIDDLVTIKAEIHKQGVNINQMARALNEYAVALGSYGIRIANEVREYRELNGRLDAIATDLQRIEDCLASIQAQLFEEMTQ